MLTSSESLRFVELRTERKRLSKSLLVLRTKHKVLRGLTRASRFLRITRKVQRVKQKLKAQRANAQSAKGTKRHVTAPRRHALGAREVRSNERPTL